jgi:hypothetical protein
VLETIADIGGDVDDPHETEGEGQPAGDEALRRRGEQTVDRKTL